MASKKYYAVRAGKKIGIFSTWEDCKASVDGYPGAVYKGFPTMEEAREFIYGREVTLGSEGERPAAGKLLVYVDGSFQEALQKYAFGCVFLLPDGRRYVAYGNGDNPESLKLRNVTGEMLGSMYAVKTAMKNGFDEIEIRYDYEGIEKWVTGAWQSKTDLTRKYALAMREWGSKIRILFTKVPAHSNVYYNEKADELAKQGLEEASGVPGIMLFSQMQEWTDEE